MPENCTICAKALCNSYIKDTNAFCSPACLIKHFVSFRVLAICFVFFHSAICPIYRVLGPKMVSIECQISATWSWDGWPYGWRCHGSSPVNHNILMECMCLHQFRSHQPHRDDLSEDKYYSTTAFCYLCVNDFPSLWTWEKLAWGLSAGFSIPRDRGSCWQLSFWIYIWTKTGTWQYGANIRRAGPSCVCILLFSRSRTSFQNMLLPNISLLFSCYLAIERPVAVWQQEVFDCTRKRKRGEELAAFRHVCKL